MRSEFTTQSVILTYAKTQRKLCARNESERYFVQMSNKNNKQNKQILVININFPQWQVRANDRFRMDNWDACRGFGTHQRDYLFGLILMYMAALSSPT